MKMLYALPCLVSYAGPLSISGTLTEVHQSPSPLYRAPFRQCDGPMEDLIPDSYVVWLAKGHTLQQHKQVLGGSFDLDSMVIAVFQCNPGRVCYEVKADDSSISAIRADAGVDYIDCNYRVHMFDG